MSCARESRPSSLPKVPERRTPLASLLIPTINIAGVYGWRGTNEEEGRTALPDWEDVGIKGNIFVLAFDSDILDKPEVHQALVRLRRFLLGRGARKVRVLVVPPTLDGKAGIDDYIGASSPSLEDLARLVQDDLPEPPPVSESGLPVIRTNGRFLRDISHDALKALVAANGDAPWLFVRGTTLARLRLDERGAFAEVLLVDSLRGVLDRAADFVSVTDTAIKPQRPPKDVVHDILALPSVPLPALESIVEAPLLLPSGELLVREGYDAESRVFLRLNGLASKLRTDMTLKEALGWLVEDLLVDFPFADDASLAHALCLLLQPFVRLLIDGPTPLFLIDAPARGTGKGLLADVASIVATGHQAHVMALPSRPTS